MPNWKRIWTTVGCWGRCLLCWRARRRVARIAMELAWYHLYARCFGVVIPDEAMSNILCILCSFVKFGLQVEEMDEYITAMRELAKHKRVSAEVLRSLLQEAFGIVWKERKPST